MRKFTFFTIAVTFAAATAFTGCTDEIIQPEPTVKGGELLSRTPYDYSVVEWDNVANLKAMYDGEKTLVLPWEPGGSQSVGVPNGWTDQELRNTDPKKRAYSRENGWVMAFHNLLENTSSNKYFGLYNRYTGILRIFLYEISSGANTGTSEAFMGLRLNGSTSLLNFAGHYAYPIANKKTNPMYFATPNTDIEYKDSEFKVSGNPGYKPNNWYGFEVELAYDPNTTKDNTIAIRLWGQYLSSISLTGRNSGSISGTINTVFNNSPSGTSINIGSVDFSSNNVNTTINVTQSDAATELSSKIEKGGNFVSKLWSNVKGQLPSLIGKGIKEGISSMLTGGMASATKALSKLVGGLAGQSSKPMTTTSKVDLGIQTTMELSGSTVTNVTGWGGINPFLLPQFASPNLVFSGKLGVWNLTENPTVYVDLCVKEMYYPNYSQPRAYRPDFIYNLSSVTPTINPEVLNEFKIENVSSQIVYKSHAVINSYIIPEGEEYGMTDTDQFYKPKGSSTKLTIPGMAMDYRWGSGSYNPETRYSSCWLGYDSETKNNGIMCHLYFELVSKTDSSKRYAFSKYFPVTAVKRNFSCEKETITQ